MNVNYVFSHSKTEGFLFKSGRISTITGSTLRYWIYIVNNYKKVSIKEKKREIIYKYTCVCICIYVYVYENIIN